MTEAKVKEFGRYVLISRLGAGAMGVVYLAYDPTLDRKVALKIIRSEPGKTPGSDSTARSEFERATAERRLAREGRAMAKLGHPNVVPILDVGVHEGVLYLTMEYIEGGSLRAWMKRETPDWRSVFELMLGLGRGLAAAHAAGMVHRDFKPDNALLDGRGRGLVTDFGLVCEAEGLPVAQAGSIDANNRSDERELASRSWSHTGSQLGAMAGTPAYMAPEQLASERPTAASDQFAYCTTFFELLHGQRPFPSDTQHQRQRAMLTGQLRPRNPQVPAWCCSIIEKGLHIDPQQRHPSMDVLLEALEKGMRRQRARGRWALGAIASIVLLAGGAHLMSERHGARADCRDGAQLLAGVWDPSLRQAVDRSFAAVDGQFAQDAHRAAIRELDDYAGQWRDAFAEICQPGPAAGTRSGDDLDQQMACLRSRKSILSGVTGLLSRADREIVEHSGRALARLPALDPCLAADSAREVLDLPAEPAQRRAVENIRLQLENIQTLSRAAQLDAARQGLEQMRGELDQLTHDATRSQYHLAYAELLRQSDPEGALIHLRAARELAQRSGDRKSAAQALMGMLLFNIYQKHDYPAATRLLAPMEAHLEAIGHPPELRAQYLQNSGILFGLQGRHDEATAQFKAMHDTASAAFGPGSDLATVALVNLAWVEGTKLAHDTSVDLYRRAIRLAGARLGFEHPSLAHYYTNLGYALHHLGQHRDAVAAARRAVGICRAAPSADPLQCSYPQFMLSNFALALGDDATARSELESLHAAQSLAGRRGHGFVPWASLPLANLELRTGDRLRAVELAREIETQAPDRAPGRFDRGWFVQAISSLSRARAGQLDRARYLALAQTLDERRNDPARAQAQVPGTHRSVAYVAELALLHGDAHAALTRLDELLTADTLPPGAMAVKVHLLRARILLSQHRIAEARSGLQHARSTFPEPEFPERVRAGIDAMIAETFMKQRQWRQASEILSAAHGRLTGGAGDESLRSKLAAQLARCAAAQKQMSSARSWARAALRDDANPNQLDPTQRRDLERWAAGRAP